MRTHVFALLLLLVTAACTPGIKVTQHVGAADYDGSPKRIFIVNQLDTRQYKSLPEDFAAAIEPALAKCEVAASVYRPDGMELNAEAKIKTAVQQFKPDAVLGFQLTSRVLAPGGSTDTYSVRLFNVVQKRDIWRADVMTINMASTLQKDPAGAVLADQLLRTMVGDKVIKTCPPFPPQQ